MNHTIARVSTAWTFPEPGRRVAGDAPARARRVPRCLSAADSSALDLSVVIPVYNEEENLPPLWAELRSVLEGLRLRFEIIFVDDGSHDRSAEIVRSFRDADPRVRLVRLKANAGETAATDAGFKAARGRLVATMDADLQNDPADLPALLGQLDTWDAATGWRVERGAGDTWVRRLSSRVANGIRNTISDGRQRQRLYFPGVPPE